MSDTSLMTREPSRRYRDKEKESLPVNDPRPGAISVQGVGGLSAVMSLTVSASLSSCSERADGGPRVHHIWSRREDQGPDARLAQQQAFKPRRPTESRTGNQLTRPPVPVPHLGLTVLGKVFPGCSVRRDCGRRPSATAIRLL